MHDTQHPYAGYRYPAEIISHAVWLYFRFTLSDRDVECWPRAASWSPTRRSARGV